MLDSMVSHVLHLADVTNEVLVDNPDTRDLEAAARVYESLSVAMAVFDCDGDCGDFDFDSFNDEASQKSEPQVELEGSDEQPEGVIAPSASFIMPVVSAVVESTEERLEDEDAEGDETSEEASE